MNHLTDWTDLPPSVWEACLERALWHRRNRVWTDAANGKALGLLFFNPSLRTRTSMELAAAHLGAMSTVLTPGQGTWNLEWQDRVMDSDRAEHVREAIGVLSRYVDALGVRTFAGLVDRDEDEADVAFWSIVDAASVPVVNLESASWHPCQALGDAATIRDVLDGEAKGRRFVLQWAPHPKALPQAVPNSAVTMAARLGMEVTVARPDGFELSPSVMEEANRLADAAGGQVRETSNRQKALDGADVVYAKAWAGSLVYDDPKRERKEAQAHLPASAGQAGADWTLTAEDMARTNAGRFMHCLPVRRGVVTEAEVLEGPNAVHLLQAEYRLHAQKAILEWMWNLLPTSQ